MATVIPSTRLMTLLKKNMSKSESNILTELEVAELLSIKQQATADEWDDLTRLAREERRREKALLRSSRDPNSSLDSSFSAALLAKPETSSPLSALAAAKGTLTSPAPAAAARPSGPNLMAPTDPPSTDHLALTMTIGQQRGTIERLHLDKASYERDLAEAKVALSSVQARLSQAEQARQGMAQELLEASQMHRRELEQAQRDQDFLQDQLDQQTSSLRREVKELRDQLLELQGGSPGGSQLQKLEHRLAEERARHREEIAARESATKGTEDELRAALAHALAELQTAAAMKPSRELALTQELETLRASHTTLQEEIAARLEERQDWKQELERSEAAREEAQAEVAALRRERDVLRQERAEQITAGLGIKPLSPAHDRLAHRVEQRQRSNEQEVASRNLTHALSCGLTSVRQEARALRAGQAELRHEVSMALRQSCLAMGHFSQVLSRCWSQLIKIQKPAEGYNVHDIPDPVAEELPNEPPSASVDAGVPVGSLSEVLQGARQKAIARAQNVGSGILEGLEADGVKDEQVAAFEAISKASQGVGTLPRESPVPMHVPAMATTHAKGQDLHPDEAGQELSSPPTPVTKMRASGLLLRGQTPHEQGLDTQPTNFVSTEAIPPPLPAPPSSDPGGAPAIASGTSRWSRGEVFVYGRLAPVGEGTSGAVAAVAKDHRRVQIRKGLDSREYTLSQVTAGSEGNSDVYHALRGIAEAALEGNVCILFYGETESGKAEAMGTAQRGGLFQHLARDLVQLQAQVEGHIELSFVAHACDIYLETVRDLLPDTANPVVLKKKVGRPSAKSSSQASQDLGGKSVSGLRQLEAAYETAQSRRLPARLPNGQLRHGLPNPRTHFVFTLSIKQRDPLNGETATTKLTLVDLAGSETWPRNSAPDVQKAHRQANKGLSAVGDVLMALAAGHSHIPYRNSKLTSVLRDSLSRGGVAVLVANVNPEEVHLSESLNTLSFASQVAALGGAAGEKRATPGDP